MINKTRGNTLVGWFIFEVSHPYWTHCAVVFIAFFIFLHFLPLYHFTRLLFKLICEWLQKYANENIYNERIFQKMKMLSFRCFFLLSFFWTLNNEKSVICKRSYLFELYLKITTLINIMLFWMYVVEHVLCKHKTFYHSTSTLIPPRSDNSIMIIIIVNVTMSGICLLYYQ